MPTITEAKLNDLKSGKLTAEQNIKQFLEVIKKRNTELNALLYVAENEALTQAKEVDRKLKAKTAGRLAGLAIAIKSCINVTGMPITCASKTLENYHGTFDADVVARIKKEDGIIISMTNMDEFAAGGSGEKSAFGPTKNPRAPGRIPGGSSSGSAVAVAAGLCDLALGSDTGGSIRNPASHCGIVGIKPSYGRVSRYGLVDLSMSLDQIGPLSPDVFGAALLMEVIADHSESDPTTFDEPAGRYTAFKTPKIKIGMSDEFRKLCLNKELYTLIETAVNTLAKKIGAHVEKVSLKYTHLGVQTYYPIVYTEFFSGTRKFDGRRYGKKIEDAAGEEVLRRIFGGREMSRAEHAGQYYRKALATKNLIKKDFERAFNNVDVIMTPTVPDLPYMLGKSITPEEDYALDAFTVPANLAGIAGGVVPVGAIKGMPVGLQVLVPAFKEDILFNFLKAIEEQMSFVCLD